MFNLFKYFASFIITIYMLFACHAWAPTELKRPPLKVIAEWKRLAREQKPLSLILCDVDKFKLYNDCYGHLGGDDCLITIAQTMQQMVHPPARANASKV